MIDNTIPSAARFPLYLSSRYLQELGVALRLIGILTTYERPGQRGIVVPRLYVEHPARGRLREPICAFPEESHVSKREWWFAWLGCCPEMRRCICQASDLPHAARIIAEQLREGA